MFDFIGARTNCAFRKGWIAHAPRLGASIQPGYPPANEHYYDWVVTLLAVDRCKDTFRMAELGAGWGPWLTRAAMAASQRPQIKSWELVAVEADAVHHKWVHENFKDNNISGPGVQVLRGAVTKQSGTILFPNISNPDENYGASIRNVSRDSDYIEVPAYSVADIIERFSGPVDLMHVDIQGAEYEALPPAMSLLLESVRSIMIGTHQSIELHHQIRDQFVGAGWREVFNFERNSLSETPVGSIQFGDGFLFFENPAL